MKLPLIQEDRGAHRRRLLVRGVVQGVGFRPYVYHLAERLELTGFVRNTVVGVVIEIEGTRDAIHDFEEALPREGPPLMRIVSVEATDLAVAGDGTFLIRESEPGANASAWVPSDVAACAPCLAEMHEPSDRRFEMACEGTSLASSRLEIEPVRLLVFCPQCNSTHMADPQHVLCPRCLTPEQKILEGRELEVRALELAA